MNFRRRGISLATLGILLAPAIGAVAVRALSPEPVPLRVLVHDSFSLPKPLIAQFEQRAGVKLEIVKGGDAGEVVNKLILTRAQPIADVIYGIDNTLVQRARRAGVLAPLPPTDGTHQSKATLDDAKPVPAQAADEVMPVDYGFVTLNVDKAWFAAKGLAMPTSLQQLAEPAYKGLLVVQNPATSSPGQAFLMATVGGLGEEAAFDWWARMRANGLKVAKGWTEAYYTEFSKNGGTRPIVVSYASSPAAEVFYSKEKITESPTANLFLKGGVFRQVEGVAMVKGGSKDRATQTAAAQFIAFLRSPEAQAALQTSMWMFPAAPGVPRVDAMRFANEPAQFDNPPVEQMASKGRAWQERWTRVVLK